MYDSLIDGYQPTVRNKAKILSSRPLKEAFVILEINIAKLGAFYLTPKIMIVHAELGFPSKEQSVCSSLILTDDICIFKPLKVMLE